MGSGFSGCKEGRRNLDEAQCSLCELTRYSWENGKTRQLDFAIKQILTTSNEFKFVSDLYGIKLETSNRKMCENFPDI